MPGVSYGEWFRIIVGNHLRRQRNGIWLTKSVPPEYLQEEGR